MKRVVCLYRVSTVGQVDHDDMPIDQGKVDKSTETWLDSIEDRLTYKHWYAGHYHTEKDIDRLTLLFESIREFKA